MKIKNIFVALSLCAVAVAASAQKRYAIITMLDDKGETITKEVALSPGEDENWKFYGKKNAVDGDYVECKSEKTTSELKIKVEIDKSVEGIISGVKLLFYDENCDTDKPVYAFDDFYAEFPDGICTIKYPDLLVRNVNLPLEYGKTYFYQAAVRLKSGDTYYSKIESFSAGLPPVDVVYKQNAGDKFTYGYCSMNDYIVAPDLSAVYEKYAAVIGSKSKEWNQTLLEYYAKTQNPDITKAVKQVETFSGMLYFIEECDADALMNEFLNDAKGGYFDGITTPIDSLSRYAVMDTIEVPAESPWYEQVQRYALFTPTGSSNYDVTYGTKGYLLPGREYKVSLLIAPETREGEEDLPSRVRINMVTDGKESSTYTEAETVSTVEHTFIPDVITDRHSVMITTRVSSSQFNRKNYNRTLRLIGIKVELVK